MEGKTSAWLVGVHQGSVNIGKNSTVSGPVLRVSSEELATAVPFVFNIRAHHHLRRRRRGPLQSSDPWFDYLNPILGRKGRGYGG